MKKQSLLNRAVKIVAVSMLTFGLFFNVEIDLEIGKYGIPALKSLTLGSNAYAQDEELSPGVEDPTVATGCKYTGNPDDECTHRFYIINKCLQKSVVDNTPSSCGYNP